MARDDDAAWIAAKLRVTEATIWRMFAESKSIDHATAKCEAFAGHLNPAQKAEVFDVIAHCWSDPDKISDAEALRRIRAAIVAKAGRR